MKKSNQIFLIGFLLVAFGSISIINNFNFIKFNIEYFWEVGLLTIGIAFLLYHFKSTQNNACLITGVILILIALMISMQSTINLNNKLTGAMVLWIISSIFIFIHFRKNKNWWAIIPGGIFFILAVIMSIQNFQLLSDKYFKFILFFGISLIFWYLFFTNKDDNKFKWTKPTAAISLIIALLIFIATIYNNIVELILPIGIITLGGYLIYRNKHVKSIAESAIKNNE